MPETLAFSNIVDIPEWEMWKNQEEVIIDGDLPQQEIHTKNISVVSRIVDRVFKYFISNTEIDLTSEIEKTMAGLYELGIVIPRPKAIREYFFNYSDVTNLLLTISKEAREVFGEERLLYIQVYDDTRTNNKYLTLYVHQEHYSEPIIEKIELIQNKYNDEIAGKHGKLRVMTDLELRFSGIDLEYYRQNISPEQFDLLFETIGILPAPEEFDPEKTFYLED